MPWLHRFPPTANEPASAGREGFCVLLTGLSGSGKSTISRALDGRWQRRRAARLRYSTATWSGVTSRSELGFSREHRDLNVLRIGWVASEIVAARGHRPLPRHRSVPEMRREVRRMIEPLGGFLLVHVSTPLETCEARDPKGLYAKARAGSLTNFTGVSDPYESPSDAELTIDTRQTSVDEAAALIVARLTSDGYLVDGA